MSRLLSRPNKTNSLSLTVAMLVAISLAGLSSAEAGDDFRDFSTDEGLAIVADLCPGDVTIGRDHNDQPVVQCSQCPAFANATGEGREQWQLTGLLKGSFSEGDVDEVLISLNGCEVQWSMNSGAALLARRIGEQWVPIEYWPNRQVRNCDSIEGSGGREFAICTHTVSDTGYSQGFVLAISGGRNPEVLMRYSGSASVSDEGELRSQIFDRVHVVESEGRRQLEVRFIEHSGVVPEHLRYGLNPYYQAVNEGVEFEEEQVVERFSFDGRQFEKLEEGEQGKALHPPPSAPFSAPAPIEDFRILRVVMEDLCGADNLEMEHSDAFGGPVPVCSVCPEVTGGNGGPWMPTSGWSGTFLNDEEFVAMVTMSGCQPHAYGFQGTLTLRVAVGQRNIRSHYQRGLGLKDCELVEQQGLPHLLCSQTHVGQGSADTYYSLVRPVGIRVLQVGLLNVIDNEGACAYRGVFKEEVQDMQILQHPDHGQAVYAFRIKVHEVLADNRGPDADICSTAGMEIDRRIEYRLVILGEGEPAVLTEGEFHSIFGGGARGGSADGEFHWEVRRQDHHGPLEAPTIEEVLNANAPKFQTCLTRSANGEEKRLVRLAIDASGSVTTASINASRTDDDPLEECLIDGLGRLTFTDTIVDGPTFTTIELHVDRS